MDQQQKENLKFQINIRLTEKEGFALKEAAKASGQSQAQLLRAVICPILQTVIAAQAAVQSKIGREVL